MPKKQSKRSEWARICPKCGFNNPALSFHCGGCGALLPADLAAEKKREPFMTSKVVLRFAVILIVLCGAGFWFSRTDQGQVYLDKIKNHKIRNLLETQPDWKSRYRHLHGVYSKRFVPPRTNSIVHVRTKLGRKIQGVLKDISEDMVLLKQGQNEIGFQKRVLDRNTRITFFRDDYAADQALRCVRAEKAKWDKAHSVKKAVLDTVLSGNKEITKSLTQIIKCPHCNGEGCYIVHFTDNRGRIQDKREVCPACGGRGFKSLTLPPGAKICPECNGMGVKVYTEARGEVKHHGYKATVRCKRCAGRGYIVDKSAAARATTKIK